MEHRALARSLKIALLALLCAGVATPCSWDDTPVLFLELRPDAPIDDFIDGHLGILQPSFARSHLVIAFRYLSGRPPSPVEREGFRALLRHRLDEYPDGEKPMDPGEQWERQRSSLRGIEYKYPPYRFHAIDETVYESFENCNDSAFATATATLQQRIAELGKPAAMQWLDAQEIVFANCSNDEATIPADDATLPAVLRADRTYQIAAANFYAMRYDEARARFLDIARDAKSPWQKVSRIIAVRALLRAQNLGRTAKESEPLVVADRELRAILADPSMASLHDAAWDLLAVTTLRRDPQQRFRDAARALLAGSETSARRVRVQLADYTLMWDKDATSDDELTEWVRTFQSGDAAHAVARFQSSKSLPWLVAALVHVKSDDGAVPALLEASNTHTSHLTIAYHRVRLLLAREQYDAARTEADRALASADLPQSARNLFLQQRRVLARSLDEYLRDALVKPVAFGTDLADIDPSYAALPPDAAAVISYWMPLDMLVAASRAPSLPPLVATALHNAAYTRALLLGRRDLARQLDPTTTLPTNFDLAYHLTQHTELTPYVEGLGTGDTGAWWCKGGSPWARATLAATPIPRFLDTDDPADAESETLQSLGHAPDWIFRTILAHAKSHPTDPRVPEALSLAIKETRHACGNDATAALAKQAFQLLHRRYAATTWAADTPYWYKP